MGGFMPYGRFRRRNGLEWRPEPDRHPYPARDEARTLWHPRPLNLIVGDLNRMERDYLDPGWAKRLAGGARLGAGPDPAEDTAAATGVPVETVRAVLAHVFRASR